MKSSLCRLFSCAVLLAPVGLSPIANAAEGPIGRFAIAGFSVDGNTLLSKEEITDLLKPYAGQNRDFGDIQRALEALENVYHRRGYTLVRVALPEQELNQGVVRLRVVESRVNAVKVHGNKFFTDANIRRSLPGLREGESPNITNVSASLRMANENPAKKTRMKLRSSAVDEAIDVDLAVEDNKPWSVTANLDNSGNNSTGKHHLSVGFQHANIADLDHLLSMQYTTTVEKPSQVSVYGVGYHIPLYARGDSIDLFGSYSDVDSGTVTAGLLNLQISGKGSVAGARYNQSLSHSDSYTSRLVYGLDYKAFKSDVQFVGIQIGNDVTVHPLSLSYVGVWSGNAHALNYSLTGVHNIPGGSMGGGDAFNRARTGASSYYKLIRYGTNYTRALAGDWQTRWTLNGQWTRNSLIPGEQFGAGGANSVRGFPERELSNDSGHFFSAELYTPNLCKKVKNYAMQCRVLGFSDVAAVSRNHALPGEQAHASIGSVGLGLRVNVDKVLSWQIDLGHVIDAGVTQAKGSNRLHFRLSMAY